MSEAVVYAPGYILEAPDSGRSFSVVYMDINDTVLCERGTEKFRLYPVKSSRIYGYIEQESLEVAEEKPEEHIFDLEEMNPAVRKDYEQKLKVINEVKKIYGPKYLGLKGKAQKPELREILKENGMKPNTFWRTIRKYLQNGMDITAVVDKRAFISEKKEYVYTKKPGRKPDHFVQKGIVIDEVAKAHMTDALNEYKSGRCKTMASAFSYLINVYYSTLEAVNGTIEFHVFPIAERPTIKQFRDFIHANLSEKEIRILKTSAQEERNNNRALKSDTLKGVRGPGDLVEVDECEADISLVSSVDSSQTIGRPIVYFMIDVYTRMILAVSVAFDNNSVMGITNLFLNLADNKREFCARYGKIISDDDLWPTGIIPDRIRTDRGAEYKSAALEEICNRLDIELQNVSGGSGSLKGVVEQTFHEMNMILKAQLENYGLIQKRHDSKHHKQATLNISQYTEMVVSFVLHHNRHYIENYRLTRDMRSKGVQKIPADLWRYGVAQYGQPRGIRAVNQYLWNLMDEGNAKVGRGGIVYKELYYLPDNDASMDRKINNMGRRHERLKIRMDLRSIDHIYYEREKDHRLMRASLNEEITGNTDYRGITMAEWEAERRERKKQDAWGRAYNEEEAAYTYGINEGIIDNAKKSGPSNDKNMRPARKAEKYEVERSQKMDDRMEDMPKITEKYTKERDNRDSFPDLMSDEELAEYIDYDDDDNFYEEE